MEIIKFTKEALGPAQTGNKAARLAELANAGFRIPPFFVISPQAFLDSRELRHSASESGVSPSDEVAGHITKALCRLCPDGATVAVRSSSVEEDGAQNSFAGQFVRRGISGFARPAA